MTHQLRAAAAIAGPERVAGLTEALSHAADSFAGGGLAAHSLLLLALVRDLATPTPAYSPILVAATVTADGAAPEAVAKAVRSIRLAGTPLSAAVADELEGAARFGRDLLTTFAEELDRTDDTPPPGL